MSIDFQSEELLPLSDVCKYVPRRNGKRIHLSTIYRWCSNGVRGIVLESLQCGGARVTSFEALKRFFDRLSNPQPSAPPDTRSLKQAEAELERAGI